MNVLLSVLLPLFSAVLSAAPLLPAPPPASPGAARTEGKLLGLELAADGNWYYERRDQASGQKEWRPLSSEQARRVLTALSRLPEADPEPGLAEALQSYLGARMSPAELEAELQKGRFFARDPRGRWVLTALGKSVLLGILTAEEGGLAWRSSPGKGLADEKGAGAAALKGAAPVLSRGGQAFDGAGRLGSFDWNGFSAPVSAAGGPASVSEAARREFAIDEGRNTVRVFAEGSVDEKLARAYGAKTSRSVDGLSVLEVPLPQASAFGLALKERGIASRPVRAYRSAVSGLSSPAAAYLGAQFLPVPDRVLESLKPQLADSEDLLGSAALAALSKGKGALVGVLDSGVDVTHPDLAGRIQSYKDFTADGDGKDYIGHGTHVTGTIGGSGAASEGKFAGLATEARFKVAKVFDKNGDTNEEILLEAADWMKQGEKVDVLNMSLGGPGNPEEDLITAKVNELAAKDGILVVAAAGNSGPDAASVGSPGNARYAMTVGGVTKKGEVSFFSARGPVFDGEGRLLYGKPDVLGVGGDVDLVLFLELQREAMEKERERREKEGKEGGVPEGEKSPAAVADVPVGRCIYKDGIIAPRSSDDKDEACALAGGKYRFMSGTSMATPMLTGLSADVIAYLKAHGVAYDAFQVKSLVMETARDVSVEKEAQGAGLASGGRMAAAVIDRVKRGLPVGNVAFELAMRLTSRDLDDLKSQARYEMTSFGLLDLQTGELVNREEDIEAVLERIRREREEPALVVKKAGETASLGVAEL